MRKLFPRVQPRRRPAAGGDGHGPGATGPFASHEIDRIRRELLRRGTAVACPRCGTALESLAPVRRSETEAVVWRARCGTCRQSVNVRAVPAGAVSPPQFGDLVLSNPHRARLAATPRWVLSAAVHALLIAGAVLATRERDAFVPSGTGDTTRIVLVDLQRPERRPEAPRPPEPPRLLPTLTPPPLAKGFQTVVAPLKVPVDLPPVDLATRFDPRDFSGVGVEGGVWDGVEGASEAGEAGGTGDAPLPAGVVDEPPRALSSPTLRYPEPLRAAGIQGFVVVGFVVDTTGRAEPGSISVVASSNPGFEAAAKEMIRKSRYRPGRMRGQRVRTLATQRVDFTILGLGRN